MIIGNKIVQQTDINWSNLILGNEALTQIKIKIKKEVLTAKSKLEQPSIKEEKNIELESRTILKPNKSANK